jgi:chromosomal replication initiator protein
MNDHDLWQNALVQIELSTSEASFKTWFKGTEILRRDGGDVFVAVPSKIVKEWLREKHHKLILKTLRDLDESVRSVEYIVHKNVRQGQKKDVVQQPQPTMEIQDLYIDKRDNLNPRYTFETFVIGPFNQLAHAAAHMVAQRPSLTYNPLFIYGKTGHGKTHLIQAIGNHIKKSSPQRKVFYVTSERFAVDYINAVKSGKANSFKDHYRQYDLLIMDDVQFIANTEKTQEELFHLFNALYDNNKQIVFSSDKHPNNLPGFEDRLKSRFSAGLIAEIPEPDFESRVTIIKAKSAMYHFSIQDDVVAYVAEQVHGNVRELEGAINAIMCKTQLKGAPLTQQEVASLIKHSAKPQKGVSVGDVVKKVSQFYGIDERSIYEKTRKKEVVRPRQVIMYILREEYNVSYPSIGEKLGGRDHTTVIHSCEKIKEEIQRDTELAHEIDQVKTILTS